MTFPERLRELRRIKKKTQREVASWLGLTEGAYRAYESGRASPTPEQTQKICTGLGVTMAEFFTGVELNEDDFEGALSTDDPNRAELHRLINEMPTEKLQVAIRLLKAL